MKKTIFLFAFLGFLLVGQACGMENKKKRRKKSTIAQLVSRKKQEERELDKMVRQKIRNKGLGKLALLPDDVLLGIFDYLNRGRGVLKFILVSKEFCFLVVDKYLKQSKRPLLRVIVNLNPKTYVPPAKGMVGRALDWGKSWIWAPICVESVEPLEGFRHFKESLLGQNRNIFFKFRLPESLTDDEFLKAAEGIENNVELLALEKCKKMTDKALSTLGKFKNLKKLYLNKTVVRDANLCGLSKSIKKISLSDCGKLTDEGVGSLCEVEDLETLHLSKTKITGFCFTFFKESKLKNLYLRCCYELKAGWIDALKGFICLIDLNLDWANNIAISDIKALPKTIKKLSLSRSGIFPDKFGEALSVFKNLEYLSLSVSSKLEDKNIEMLPETITCLVLNSCSKLTDKGINKMLGHLTKLEKLYLAYTKVTDEGLRLLPIETLKKINLRGCKGITCEFVVQLRKKGIKVLRYKSEEKRKGGLLNFIWK